VKLIKHFLAVYFFSAVLMVIPSWSQLIIGQYQDEASFRSWNNLGIASASSLGMGEVIYPK